MNYTLLLFPWKKYAKAVFSKRNKKIQICWRLKYEKLKIGDDNSHQAFQTVCSSVNIAGKLDGRSRFIIHRRLIIETVRRRNHTRWKYTSTPAVCTVRCMHWWIIEISFNRLNREYIDTSCFPPFFRINVFFGSRQWQEVTIDVVCLTRCLFNKIAHK